MVSMWLKFRISTSATDVIIVDTIIAGSINTSKETVLSFYTTEHVRWRGNLM